jgi:hypothetical protein
MRSLSSRVCSLSPLPQAHTSARLPGWEVVLYFSGRVTGARCSIFSCKSILQVGLHDTSAGSLSTGQATLLLLVLNPVGILGLAEIVAEMSAFRDHFR